MNPSAYDYKDFIKRIEDSLKEHWDQDAFTDYQGATLQYHDVARKIEKLHILFEYADIHPGDKIALCGRMGFSSDSDFDLWSSRSPYFARI